MAKSLKQMELEWMYSDMLMAKLISMEDSGATTKELIEWLEQLEHKAATRSCDLYSRYGERP